MYFPYSLIASSLVGTALVQITSILPSFNTTVIPLAPTATTTRALASLTITGPPSSPSFAVTTASSSFAILVPRQRGAGRGGKQGKGKGNKGKDKDEIDYPPDKYRKTTRRLSSLTSWSTSATPTPPHIPSEWRETIWRWRPFETRVWPYRVEFPFGIGKYDLEWKGEPYIGPYRQWTDNKANYNVDIPEGHWGFGQYYGYGWGDGYKDPELWPPLDDEEEGGK